MLSDEVKAAIVESITGTETFFCNVANHGAGAYADADFDQMVYDEGHELYGYDFLDFGCMISDIAEIRAEVIGYAEAIGRDGALEKFLSMIGK